MGVSRRLGESRVRLGIRTGCLYMGSNGEMDRGGLESAGSLKRASGRSFTQLRERSRESLIRVFFLRVASLSYVS